MCLNYKWTTEDRDKWLKDKPETITAYKVARKDWRTDYPYKTKKKQIWPPVFNTFAYRKTNRLSILPPLIRSSYGRTKKYWQSDVTQYVPGYHLFSTKYGAEKWVISRGYDNEIVLKCTIPKKDVIAVGKQANCMVIVTEEFTFVEGNEYFKKETVCA